MEQLHIRHDLNVVPGAKREHVRLIKVAIHGAQNIRPAGKGSVHNRIVVRVLEDKRRPFGGDDDIGQRLQECTCSRMSLVSSL
jgi:hypothetical protein